MTISKKWKLSVLACVIGIGYFVLECEALSQSRASIVTGANGFVGREVVHQLVASSSSDDCILCLVRPAKLESERAYWQGRFPQTNCEQLQVLAYDMNDSGETMDQALKIATDKCSSTCVFHIASVFGPTEDPVASAEENVQGTEDLVRTISNYHSDRSPVRLVLTSSTAAVRGPGQDPINGKFYTYEDWNSVSQLNPESWGSCYQWSKAESERRAWRLSKSLNLPMSVICPSFVFGPPSDYMTAPLSSSYSLTLVGQWVWGESPVQSRLCVDLRDVAKAHIAAGTLPEAIGQRFIVSTEARVPSSELALVLQEVCTETGQGDPKQITYDAKFTGGAIPIGAQEVEATERLEKILGIVLRPATQT